MGVFGVSVFGLLYLTFTIISIVAYIKAYIKYRRAKKIGLNYNYGYYLGCWTLGSATLFWWRIFNVIILLLGGAYLITKLICDI